MGSLLKDAKNYYTLFFQNGQWDESKTQNNFYDKWSDYDKRAKLIKEIYDIILDSPKNSETIKKWVSTGLSIQSIAEVSGINTNTIKSTLYYFNITIGSLLDYNGENLLKLCITRKDITSFDWQAIGDIMDRFFINMGEKIYSGEKIFSSRNLLVNIPRKGELHRNITEEEFEAFLKLIAPYFTTVRSKNQRLINESRVTGYFHYLFTPHASLQERDIMRREKILKLLDKDTKKLLKEKFKQEESKSRFQSEKNKNIQSEKNPSLGKTPETKKHNNINSIPSNQPEDDEIIDFGLDTVTGGYRTKRIQFDF